MRFRIISDSDTFTIVFLPIFYCMNVSVLVIQPPGCHNPINVMLLLTNSVKALKAHRPKEVRYSRLERCQSYNAWHLPPYPRVMIISSRLCPPKIRYITRHRASTSMYSLTFCVRFLLPERHQRKPAVQAAAVILRMPPSCASQRPAARADPAQPAVRTMSSYRGMDASL